MRIHAVLAGFLILVASSSFAETDSRHAATEELMQYFEGYFPFFK